MTFFLAGLIGIVVVTQVLPILAHRITHAVYDSGEMVERDPMHDAHSLVAQGDYEGAIHAFRSAAAADPYNRLPWVEIAKIQRNSLEDPEAAIATLRVALEGQEWPVNDAAYLLFRLAELYDEDRHDRGTAVAIMQQVIDEFPETRHSANARHKLHEWGLA
jgi:tetratricopeptide (TPR) repeat protein